MLDTVFLHVSGLLALGISARSDWKHEQFNALIPGAVFVANFFNHSVPLFTFNLGFSLIMFLMGILVATNMMRSGDMLLAGLYGLAFSSTQAFFTLLTVTGVYLYAYPKLFNEKEWIPFAPVFLTCYLLQLLSTLL